VSAQHPVTTERYSLESLIAFSKNTDCRAFGLNPVFDNIHAALLELQALRLSATARDGLLQECAAAFDVIAQWDGAPRWEICNRIETEIGRSVYD